MENFIVTRSPFVRSKDDVNKMFLSVAISLILQMIYGIMFFWFNALLIMIEAVGSCLLFEIVFNMFEKRNFVINDFSSIVTGFILGLTMPINAPFWIVILSSFISIICVKFAFGGLGRNKFNPACVGRCFAGVAVAGLSGELFKITLNGEELVSITAGGTNSILNLLSGQAVGGIGTTCIFIMIICYMFLVYNGVINFAMPVIAVISYFLVALKLVGLEQGVINLLSGSFVFVSIFMLTDPNTSPDTTIGKMIYSIMFGVLSAIVWNMKFLGENTVFVVLLFVNLFAPMMDQYFVWRPLTFGGYRNAHKN